jgi:hypothetical protein
MPPGVIDADHEAVTTSGHGVFDALLTVIESGHEVIGTTHISIFTTLSFIRLEFRTI